MQHISRKSYVFWYWQRTSTLPLPFHSGFYYCPKKKEKRVHETQHSVTSNAPEKLTLHKPSLWNTVAIMGNINLQVCLTCMHIGMSHARQPLIMQLDVHG